jgi:hypothetical protein
VQLIHQSELLTPTLTSMEKVRRASQGAVKRVGREDLLFLDVGRDACGLVGIIASVRLADHVRTIEIGPRSCLEDSLGAVECQHRYTRLRPNLAKKEYSSCSWGPSLPQASRGEVDKGMLGLVIMGLGIGEATKYQGTNVN